jgi:Zn-dependent peptidase ImmA (M78 family)
VFQRGFKASCENIARLQRRQLNLAPADPLNPRELANRLGVVVHTVEEVPDLSSDCIRTLLHEDADSWSAVTISANGRSVIIINSSHAKSRLASDLVHEIAHILIGHSPSRIDLTEDGSLMLSTYSRQQEDEANWLAGCLLLPREALILIRKERLDLSVAARKYGTSLAMLNYRINVTGVDYQLQRRAAFYSARPGSS